jgi:uncharacterized protein YegP (UPF0339 family)
MDNGYFVIVPKEDGYTVELRLPDGRVLVESVLYATLDSAKRAVRSIITYIPGAPVLDHTAKRADVTANPKFEIFANEMSCFFRFRARNGKQTITSRIFTSADDCREGILVLQRMVVEAATYIEIGEELISIDTYTEQQIAHFRACMFKKEEPATVETPALETPDEPSDETQSTASGKKKGLGGFFRRIFG